MSIESIHLPSDLRLSRNDRTKDIFEKTFRA